MVKWFVSFFFFLPSQSYAIIYTCSFPFSNRFSLHYYFFVFVFVLILIFLSLSLSLLLSTIHLVFPRSSFLFVYWHELREYGTTTPLLLEFDVGRNPFILFFFFLLAGKVVRWMSMQCAHVCFLRYFKRFFQNGGIDGSRRSSKCRVANTFLTVVEENRNDLDDLVKIPTYLVRCIV